LNHLFHYLRPVGYWNRTSHNFFVSVKADFGAFSADYGGAVVA
jgi:hypothetical protein